MPPKQLPARPRQRQLSLLARVNSFRGHGQFSQQVQALSHAQLVLAMRAILEQLRNPRVTETIVIGAETAPTYKVNLFRKEFMDALNFRGQRSLTDVMSTLDYQQATLLIRVLADLFQHANLELDELPVIAPEARDLKMVHTYLQEYSNVPKRILLELYEELFDLGVSLAKDSDEANQGIKDALLIDIFKPVFEVILNHKLNLDLDLHNILYLLKLQMNLHAQSHGEKTFAERSQHFKVANTKLMYEVTKPKSAEYMQLFSRIFNKAHELLRESKQIQKKLSGDQARYEQQNLSEAECERLLSPDRRKLARKQASLGKCIRKLKHLDGAIRSAKHEESSRIGESLTGSAGSTLEKVKHGLSFIQEQQQSQATAGDGRFEVRHSSIPMNHPVTTFEPMSDSIELAESADALGSLRLTYDEAQEGLARLDQMLGRYDSTSSLTDDNTVAAAATAAPAVSSDSEDEPPIPDLSSDAVAEEEVAAAFKI